MIPSAKLQKDLLQFFFILCFENMIFTVLLRVENFELDFVFVAARSVDIVNVFQIWDLKLTFLLIILDYLTFFLIDSLLEFYFPLLDIPLFQPCGSICKRVILILFGLESISVLVGLFRLILLAIKLLIVAIDFLSFTFGICSAMPLGSVGRIIRHPSLY